MSDLDQRIVTLKAFDADGNLIGEYPRCKVTHEFTETPPPCLGSPFDPFYRPYPWVNYARERRLRLDVEVLKDPKTGNLFTAYVNHALLPKELPF